MRLPVPAELELEIGPQGPRHGASNTQTSGQFLEVDSRGLSRNRTSRIIAFQVRTQIEPVVTAQSAD